MCSEVGGLHHRFTVWHRPQARRLRRPAVRLRGLTFVPDKERAFRAADGLLGPPVTVWNPGFIGQCQ